MKTRLRTPLSYDATSCDVINDVTSMVQVHGIDDVKGPTRPIYTTDDPCKKHLHMYNRNPNV